MRQDSRMASGGVGSAEGGSDWAVHWVGLSRGRWLGGGPTEIGIKRGESHKLRASMTLVPHEFPAQSLTTLSEKVFVF